MEFTPENLCGFLIRSRLMTPAEMKNMFQRWQAASKGSPATLSQFTKWLVANNYVTEYQANLLAKGHAEPEVFFLNQYKILERLGRGRMAGVYRAVHTLGQVVAIKVLPPSRAKDPRMLTRFQREAQLALKLKHPNCVRSFQVGEAKGLHYLVMELLDGETLEDVLNRRKRLPPGEAVRVVHQALMGLQHIHEQGIVHRDLKPSNMMLVPAPARGEPDTTLRATVKILDIGLARALFEETATTPGDKLEVTGEGVILGTPDYLAPEQARDPHNIDIRADVYSLGCVLYHALTGQPPFPDGNLLNQMVRHATEAPRPVKEFNSQIPDGLQQVVGYMLAKQADQRYPTPERAAQALQMFLIAENEIPKAEAVRGEDGKSMKSYLSWLEQRNRDAVARASAENASAPHRPSKPTPPPPTKQPRDKNRHKKPKSRPELPAALPALPAGINPQDIDVELVPMPSGAATTPAAAPPGKAILGLMQRDWILIGLGAAVVLAAVVIGIIVANLF